MSESTNSERPADAKHASDSDLIRRAQDGEISAVGVLYDRHHELIFRYVWLRVHNEQLAEDLTGEIFEKMVINLPDYQLRGVPFRAWLYRIAHNLVVDHYRKESHHTLVPLYQAEGVRMKNNNPASVVEHQLTLEEVRQALNKLTPSQREAVILRFLVGLSLHEVALALGKTVGAVKSLQHRGLVALRKALSQET